MLCLDTSKHVLGTAKESIETSTLKFALIDCSTSSASVESLLLSSGCF